jgi:hypothetical protein
VDGEAHAGAVRIFLLSEEKVPDKQDFLHALVAGLDILWIDTLYTGRKKSGIKT